MPQVTSTVEVGAAYPTVRPLYERADGLAALTPSWLSLEFTPMVGPLDPVEAGTRFRVAARPFGRGFRLEGVVEIIEARFGPDETVVEDRFVDGPFGSWRHRRRLRPVDAGTEVVDDIRYRDPPGGVIGRLTTPVLLSVAMAYRSRRLRAKFGRVGG